MTDTTHPSDVYEGLTPEQVLARLGAPEQVLALRAAINSVADAISELPTERCAQWFWTDDACPIFDWVQFALRMRHPAKCREIYAAQEREMRPPLPSVTQCESQIAPEDLREHSFPVFGLGAVRIRHCGHPLEPDHFQTFSDNIIRAVCPHCHTETLVIEIDPEELDRRDVNDDDGN
jgi:hypothetical protein